MPERRYLGQASEHSFRQKVTLEAESGHAYNIFSSIYVYENLDNKSPNQYFHFLQNSTLFGRNIVVLRNCSNILLRFEDFDATLRKRKLPIRLN